MSGSRKSTPALTVRLLGEMSLERGGRTLELPPSRKTRALLAYLIATGKPHRRERLCSLLWDVADDPRAALRWSLSKLRPLVDDPERPRIVTDGSLLRFEPAGARIDLFDLRALVTDGATALSVDELEAAAADVRGPFCEGLELSDFYEFQAWCVGVREEVRGLHARLLEALVERIANDTDRALPHARVHAQIDPYDAGPHIRLLRLLARAGRGGEAAEHFRSASRLLFEVGGGAGAALAQAWQEIDGGTRHAKATTAPAPLPTPPLSTAPLRMVGRDAEWQRVRGALDATLHARRLRLVLVVGEPGIGKTRLLAELIAETMRRGGTVLEGASYEAEMRRPYGPWIDALQRLPPVAIGDAIGADLAPLLPQLGRPVVEDATRDRLFGAVVELFGARAHSSPPVLFVLDDVQWCDDASAELLHYAARMLRHRPVLIALSARDGELHDNEAMQRVLRGLRRESAIDEIVLGPLGPDETAELVRDAAPAADAERVFAESAGNPLFALEVARSLGHRAGDVPLPLRRLVRDRIDRLPADAVDVLRWAAVIGHTFDLQRLGLLAQFDPDRLAHACEALERHALLRAWDGGAATTGAYAFAHDVVRQVLYTELSEPRRRMMHARVLRALQEVAKRGPGFAVELARHAASAGDNDAAARACLDASRDCLRVFGSAEAYALARDGMHHARALADPGRVKLLLELAEVRLAARPPQDREVEAGEVETLAREAMAFGCLDHARLGFHLASYIRWEGGDWSDAKRAILQAEQISRDLDPAQRAAALAEASRCLCLLDRDHGHARALLLEAEALAALLPQQPSALTDALGLIAVREGRLDDAVAHFEQAHRECQREADRLGEFRVLEHLLEVQVERGRLAEAEELCSRLLDIATRLREGSEAPAARVCAALVRYLREGEAAEGTRQELETSLEALRTADAKQRLTCALIRASSVDAHRGEVASARQRAEEALRLALLLERPSDTVLARAAVLRAARLQGDRAAVAAQEAAVRRADLRIVSVQARAAAEAIVGLSRQRGAGKPRT